MPLGLRPCGLKIKPVMNGSHCFKLAREIQKAKYNLKRWYRTILDTPEQESWSFENDIEVLQSKDPTEEMEKIKQHSLELDNWLENEELCWKQKSRELWIQEKD